MLLVVAFVFGEFLEAVASILRTSARCLKQQSVFELGQLLEAWHSCLALSLRVGLDGTIISLGQSNSPALEVRLMSAPSLPLAPLCVGVSAAYIINEIARKQTSTPTQLDPRRVLCRKPAARISNMDHHFAAQASAWPRGVRGTRRPRTQSSKGPENVA